MPMRPFVVGHRGAPNLCPENTIPSFLKAIEVGVDIIELDVRRTKDNELIVFHDERLERTTNGKGFVRDLLLEEIKQLDAGSWFGEMFKDTKVPTLKEALEEIGGKVFVRIEIKDEGIEEKVVKTVKDLKLEEKVAIASFNLNSLRKVKEILPSLPIVAITSNFSRKFIYEALAHCANTIAARYGTFSREDVREAQLHGLTFDVWVIDDEKSLRNVLSCGVNSITSNKPNEISYFINK